MNKYWVTISGSVEVIAEDERDAIKQARDLAGVCSSYNPQEIGKNVDENGWPIKSGETMTKN